MPEIKVKEVNEFARKVHGKSSSGNDALIYKVYKKFPLLRNKLFLLLREASQKKIVEEWCQLAEGIYLPKEENSADLGQFRLISLLNIDGKILFGIIGYRVIDYAKKNEYIYESVQKAGLPKIPGCTISK